MLIYLLFISLSLTSSLIAALPIVTSPAWSLTNVETGEPVHSASKWSELLQPFRIQVSVQGVNGQPQLPHVPSGPWGSAYDMITEVVDRAKLFKRGFTSSRAGVNHLRPQTWRQWFKDLWRRISFRKLKVTREQYEEVKNKYRPPRSTYSANQHGGVTPGLRNKYRPQGATKPAYASDYRQNGRLKSAFPTRASDDRVQAEYTSKATYPSRSDNAIDPKALEDLVEEYRGKFGPAMHSF